jgi:hypothetical protein
MYLKVKLSPCLLLKHQAMMTWGNGGIAPPFLTLALNGGEWSASRFYFTPEETAPGTHYIQGWVGPRAGLDVMEKRKISCPYQELNPDLMVIQPVA